MSRYEPSVYQVAHQDEIARVRLENSLAGYIMHCDVYQWDKEAKLHIGRILDKLKAKLHKEGVPYILAIIPQADPKNQKFARLFGFKKYGLYPLQMNRGVEEVWVVKTY